MIYIEYAWQSPKATKRMTYGPVIEEHASTKAFFQYLRDYEDYDYKSEKGWKLFWRKLSTKEYEDYYEYA